jgi:hypothetical protein
MGLAAKGHYRSLIPACRWRLVETTRPGRATHTGSNGDLGAVSRGLLRIAPFVWAGGEQRDTRGSRSSSRSAWRLTLIPTVPRKLGTTMAASLRHGTRRLHSHRCR